MLKGIDPLLHADLLHALRAMGHGDDIAIVDANFPAAAMARRLLRLDGVNAPDALTSLLSVLPLDDFIEAPVTVMQVVDRPGEIPEVVGRFRDVVDQAGCQAPFRAVDRFAFYDRVRSAFAVVATGERRLYGNVILTKGVIRPGSA